MHKQRVKLSVGRYAPCKAAEGGGGADLVPSPAAAVGAGGGGAGVPLSGWQRREQPQPGVGLERRQADRGAERWIGGLNGDGGGSGERWIASAVALRWIGRKGRRFGGGERGTVGPTSREGEYGNCRRKLCFGDQNIFTSLPIT
jgi:hypothetical protein